jgi:hypothetical protein
VRRFAGDAFQNNAFDMINVPAFEVPLIYPWCYDKVLSSFVLIRYMWYSETSSLCGHIAQSGLDCDRGYRHFNI